MKNWQNNMSKYYLNSKLLIFPSLYEGLPNTLLDALNYSLPCITTKCSGAEDINNDVLKVPQQVKDSIDNFNRDNDFYNDKPGVIVDIFPDFNHFVVKTKDSNILVTNSSISSKHLKVGFRFLEKSGIQIPYPKF